MLAPARSRKKAPRLRPRMPHLGPISAGFESKKHRTPVVLEPVFRPLAELAAELDVTKRLLRRAFERGDIKGQVRKDGLYVDEHGAKTRASVAKGWASESKNRFVEKIKALLAKKGKEG